MLCTEPITKPKRTKFGGKQRYGINLYDTQVRVPKMDADTISEFRDLLNNEDTRASCLVMLKDLKEIGRLTC